MDRQAAVPTPALPLTSTVPPTPSWVGPFYDRKSLAAGPSGVLPHHEERAQAIQRLTGLDAARVLELGAGAGGSAVATAELGHAVTAVELSPVRARFAAELADERGAEGLQVVQGDFMTVGLSTAYDVVVMWNGFGIGDDDFQRAMLRRIHDEWLAPDGWVVLDVFNPAAWCRWAGEDAVDEETGVRQRVDFDVVGSRFLDSWWFDGPDAEPATQSVRCYSPADLRLLVEPTGLAVVTIEQQEDSMSPLVTGPLGEAWGYRVVLRRQ